MNSSALDYYAEHVHAYLAVSLCVVGVVANILCVMVLTQTGMRNPMNFLLTCLASADGLGLTIYAAIKTYLGIATSKSSRCHSQALETFIRSCKVVSGMSLAMNSWLTAGIAVSRYIIISHRSAGTVFSMKRAKVTALAAFMMTLVEHIGYISMIKVVSYETEDNATCYKTGRRQDFNQTIYNWSTFVFSFISSSLLLIFSALLVSNLLRYTRLQNRSFSIRSVAVQESRRNQAKKTTIVLLSMTVSAFLTESPFFIFTIYEEVSQTGALWFENHLDDIWKLLIILNSGMHILFLSICKNFRDNLKKSLCIPDKPSSSPSESQTMF